MSRTFKMAFNKTMDAGIAGPQDGPYGVPQTMYHGFSHAGDAMASVHPLEKGESSFHNQTDRMNMAMLRKTQGIHAPLRLMMERKAASKIQRLPCLHSSHLQYDTLTGRSDTVDIKDFLNYAPDAERVGAPHITMEKRLGIF